MSLFEYVTVMVSMILALTLSGVLGTVSLLLRKRNQLQWSAPFGLWLLALTICLINHWWALWDFHALDWNYTSFVYILIAPILITLAVGLIAPDRSQADWSDLPAHFEQVRRSFCWIFAIYAGVMWFDGPLLAGQAVFGAVGALHVPIIAASLLGAASAGKVPNILAPLVVLATLLTIMAIRFQAAT